MNGHALCARYALSSSLLEEANMLLVKIYDEDGPSMQQYSESKDTDSGLISE